MPCGRCPGALREAASFLLCSCSCTPVEWRCLPFREAGVFRRARSLGGQEYVPRWESPRTWKFMNFVAPLCWPLSLLSAAVSASFFWQYRPMRGVLLCLFALLLVLPPPPCCCVAGCLPTRRNGRPEVRLRWSAPGSCSPLGRPPLFWGALFLTHSLTHSLFFCLRKSVCAHSLGH